MKRYLSIFVTALVLLAAFSSCNKPVPEPDPDPIVNPDPEPEPEPDPEPEPEPEPEPVGTVKPILVWVDADANFKRLATKEGVIEMLDKMVAAGVNTIVLDVKPCSGYSMYDSEILDKLEEYNGCRPERDYDYCQNFIDECHARDMKILISNTIMAWGYSSSQKGRIFDDPELGQYACMEWLPTGLKPMKEDSNISVCFVNPASDYVHDFVLSVIEEQVKKYDVDGFVMDYCRYNDFQTDFSELSRQKFEEWAGVTVENFPEDICTYSSTAKDASVVPGKYYKQWIEWRSTLIHDYVRDIRDVVKKYRPEASVQLWAASWWESRYTVGQNWASPSKNYTKSYAWSTADYYKTGFADLLDVFQLGAYLNKVTPVTDGGTIAYAMNQGSYLLNKDCQMYTTFSCSNAKFPMKEAVQYGLENSDGIMIFDLCYVVGNNFWNKLKSGVEAAKNSGGAYIKE